jgi:hypothetical protein
MSFTHALEYPTGTITRELVQGEKASTYAVTMVRGAYQAAEVRRAWDTLIETASAPAAPEGSPAYFDHLLSTGRGDSVALASVRDDIGAIVGIVPIVVELVPLYFDVSWYVLGQTATTGVRILGDRLLVPARASVHDAFFTALAREFTECGIVKFQSVATADPLWQYLRHSRFVRELFDVYIPDGIRLCHTIPLPASWADFERRCGAKRRYNLKRQRRLLRERGNGSLELLRIQSGNEVRSLVEDLLAIGAESGAQRHRLIRSYATPIVDESALRSLAQHGLLLCYVLRCGGRPCAAALGSIHGRRYCLDSLPRDRDFDRFSPGATLLHLLIEDLIRQRSVRLIDLGFGEPKYKHATTNRTEPRGCVFLLRRTLPNRLRRWVHGSFKGLVGQMKSVLRA